MKTTERKFFLMGLCAVCFALPSLVHAQRYVRFGPANKGKGGTQRVKVGGGIDQQTFDIPIPKGTDAATKEGLIIAGLNGNDIKGKPSKYTASQEMKNGAPTGRVQVNLNTDDTASPGISVANTNLEDDEVQASLNLFPDSIYLALIDPNAPLSGLDSLGGPGTLTLDTNLGDFTVSTVGNTGSEALAALFAAAQPTLGGTYDASLGTYTYSATPGGFAMVENNDAVLDLAFGISSVPEPGPFTALMGMSLTGAGCALWRRRRK